MKLSLNCLIQGQTFDDAFTVVVGETYTNDEKVVIEFNKLTVSSFKEILFHRPKVQNEVQDFDNMILWKVDQKKVVSEENNKEFTEDDIKEKLGGEKMIPRHLQVFL